MLYHINVNLNKVSSGGWGQFRSRVLAKALGSNSSTNKIKQDNTTKVGLNRVNRYSVSITLELL